MPKEFRCPSHNARCASCQIAPRRKRRQPPRLPASLAIDPALRPPFATGLALALGNFALYAPGVALPAVEIAVLR